MEIQGRIIFVAPEVGGTSKAGNQWRKQEYVLETLGQYPKKICFSLWGDRIDQFNIQEGEDLTVQIDLESREFNGRWYTEVRAWNVTRGFNSMEQPQVASVNNDYLNPNIGAPSFSAASQTVATEFPASAEGDDLPF
ncbi:DUF3127 domain-containing protein [Porphyromonas circumdentaria]|uniref:DUF3127 domain-containing protein n=1 Tax=Porphyromonas circumdentaria TaxID=29524 RepID=A0A1T4NV53_9PORP|nr:DUF3127 domain-containing protein [Porphyromonas circumdentaria]MBB6276205.1 hypothetical protein [Porphyromonas circumdentaria]MDO4722308.1 DUF3127 domain-containing protein [Porphyromonas circumdentaria]SJZ82916.1 protein of unknown function [Porphyromonas circumdentaria]